MPRPDVSEERKNQIMDAAMRVFARLGFHDARMDDIAKQAGLSKGALYLYYRSKDAVFAAIVKFFFTQAFKHVRAFIEKEDDGPVAGKLLRMTDYFTSQLKWMASLMPITFEFYAIAARQKDMRDFFRSAFGDFRQVLAGLVQRGIDRGEFRAVSPDMVAVALTALYEGLALLWVVDPQGLNPEQTGAAVTRLVLDGLLVHPPAAPTAAPTAVSTDAPPRDAGTRS